MNDDEPRECPFCEYSLVGHDFGELTCPECGESVPVDNEDPEADARLEAGINQTVLLVAGVLLFGLGAALTIWSAIGAVLAVMGLALSVYQGSAVSRSLRGSELRPRFLKSFAKLCLTVAGFGAGVAGVHFTILALGRLVEEWISLNPFVLMAGYVLVWAAVIALVSRRLFITLFVLFLQTALLAAGDGRELPLRKPVEEQAKATT